MGLAQPNQPLAKKVFQILEPAGSAAAAQSGFNAARNYFPGLQQTARIPQPLPVSQAIGTAPTAAQIVQQAAGVPKIAAAAPIEQAAQKALPQFAQFRLPASSVASEGASLALPGAEALGPVLSDAAKAPDLIKTLPEGLGTRALSGKIATVALPAAVGLGTDYATDQLFRALNGGENPEGRWDEVLGGFMGGAGAAGIASGGNPIAILAGGIGGGLLEFFGGDESEAKKRKVAAKLHQEINDESRNYMKLMDVSTGDQDRIMAQLQYQSAGVKPQDLPDLYRSLLPQYIDAATQISDAKAQQTLAEQSRTNRLAAIQGYLMPQLTGFLNTAQQDADAFGRANHDPKYAAMQAQTNAAYMSQLAALTQMSQGSAQPTQSAPTLDQYLQASLIQSQAADPQSQIDAIIAGKQAQSQIAKQAKVAA